MDQALEEKLREASCAGDYGAARALLARNVNVNSRNPVNGWTALHWACKRGNERVASLLLQHGADAHLKNFNNETARDVCPYFSFEGLETTSEACEQHVPHCLDNAQVYDSPVQVEPHFFAMPETSLPATQHEDALVLKVRKHDSSDPDFIEVELPRSQLTYQALLKLCCNELRLPESQVQRIRKLPDTRLRNDRDVKRLSDLQALEVVLNNSDKSGNSYQSIGSCKNQTVLY